jgi:hypothetical protein
MRIVQSRRVVVGMVVALVTTMAGEAFADRIRCASRDYRYAFCETNGRVVRARIVDRHSKRPCLQDYSWGIEANGIWVDDGCDADFDVVVRGFGGGPRPPFPVRPPVVDAPGWAVGEWRGDGIRLTVFRGGSVILSRGRGNDRGYMSGNEVVLYNGSRIGVDRDRRGLRLEFPGGRRAYVSRSRSFDYRLR